MALAIQGTPRHTTKMTTTPTATVSDAGPSFGPSKMKKSSKFRLFVEMITVPPSQTADAIAANRHHTAFGPSKGGAPTLPGFARAIHGTPMQTAKITLIPTTPVMAAGPGRLDEP